VSTDSLFEHFYFSRPDFIRGTEAFHKVCRNQVHARSRTLEIGSGPTNATSALLAGIGSIAGIDISDEVLGNIHLDEAKRFDGRIIPYPDNSFDYCVSDWVLEHVEAPEQHFLEVARVLKPGGRYCFRTMNLWHYVSFTSRMLPHSLHLLLSTRLRNLPKDAHDPYPTYYRANTHRRLAALAKGSNLIVDEIDHMEPEPSYGRRHAILFYPMMVYERIVNCAEAFANFRVTLLGTMRKP
jgi:SAM-dependent methyltransferase